MEMNGNNSNRRSQCKFRQTKIEEETRTSGGGRYCDHCRITNAKCDKRRCVFHTGGE